MPRTPNTDERAQAPAPRRPAELKTRPPTGKVSYPLILVEGEEKAGKSFASLLLSASSKVGRTFVLELDEPTADEYAALGPFEIIEHDGTFTSVDAMIEAACAVPMEADKPNVIILDSGTALWDLIKDWVNWRARNSRNGRRVLAEDPDAEIDASMNLWNDGKDRWYRVMNRLRLWPGIAIVTARAQEVAKVVNGSPVAGQYDYSISAEKTTKFAVTAWVRFRRPHTASLIAVRSLSIDLPKDGIVLPGDSPLEHLIFEILGAGGEFTPSPAILPRVGVPARDAQRKLLALLTGENGLNADDAKAAARSLWDQAGLKSEVTDREWAALEQAAAEHLANIAASGERAKVRAVVDALDEPRRLLLVEFCEAAAIPLDVDALDPDQLKLLSTRLSRADLAPPATDDGQASLLPPADAEGADEPILAEVAAMNVDEVVREIEARTKAHVETGKPDELRRRLSRLIRGEKEAPSDGLNGAPPEIVDQAIHDVQSYSPEDVDQQLRDRGLFPAGRSNRDQRRAILTKSLIRERVKAVAAESS